MAYHRSRSRGVGARIIRRRKSLTPICHCSRDRSISLTPITNPAQFLRPATSVPSQIYPMRLRISPWLWFSFAGSPPRLGPVAGCVGPLAGNVKLEDDGVMGHPVVPEFMRSAFVFPSTAVGLMPNAGECPKFLRCVYAEALGESVVAIRPWAETSRTLGSGAASCGCWPTVVLREEFVRTRECTCCSGAVFRNFSSSMIGYGLDIGGRHEDTTEIHHAWIGVPCTGSLRRVGIDHARAGLRNL